MADKNVCTTSSLGSISDSTNAIVETNGTLARVNLATKVNRYSTSEIPIGTWINGKTLYRKVWEFNITTAQGKYASGLTYSDIDTVTSLTVVSNCSAGKTAGYCDGDDAAADFLRVYLNTSAQLCIQGAPSMPPLPYTAVVIMEYTKV